VTSLSAGLQQFYIESTEPFNRVILVSLPSGYAIDNLTSKAVPEPSTLALFAFGLAGLGFTTRPGRRKLS
jgi:hypothetical protein